MKKISLVILLLINISCTSTLGVPLSDKKEGWFNAIRRGDYVVLPNPLSVFNPFLTRGFMYCKANDIEGTPLANPICYEVKYSKFTTEKQDYNDYKLYESKNDDLKKVKN